MSSKWLPLRSIKARVTFSTLGIFVLSIWLLAIYACHALREDLQHMVGEQLFSTVTLAAQDFDRLLVERFKALNAVSAAVTPQLLQNTAALQAYLEHYPVFQQMFNGGAFITDLNGTAIAAIPTSAGRLGINFMERDFLIAVLQKGKTSIGSPVIGKKAEVPLFAMAVPIHDARGMVTAALVGVTFLGRSSAFEQLTRNRYGKTGGYFVAAPQSNLIVTATDKRLIMQPVPALGRNAMLARFVQGYEGYGIASDAAGVEQIMASKQIPTSGWILSAALPTEEAFAPVNALQLRLFGGTFVLTLLAGALTWWMLQRQLSPLMSTIRSLARLPRSAQLPMALPITSNDEVGELIVEFNQLLVKLNEREKRLIDSDLHWKFAVEGSGDGMWDWNIAAGIIFYSPRYKEMLGYTDADFGITSDEWVKRIHPHDAPRVIAALQPYRDGKRGVVSIEFRMLRKDGHWLWILGRGMVMERDAQGKAVRMIGTNTDISARKATEAALQQALVAAEAANQSKSRFLANASHDLRQPMAALALYTSLLGSAVKPGQDKLVANMQSCVENLGGFLNDLLDVSKLDAGVLVPKVTDFPFEGLCNALHAIYSSKAEKKGLHLRCRHAANLTLRTDQRMLHRLLGNVIDNAVGHTLQGGVLVATRRHGGKLWLEVWDTGIGMAEDQIPLIFEEFRQLGDNARNRGSGLGLAIVAKMAELLGLKIRVRSRLGRGTVFAVSLPEGGTQALPQTAPPVSPATFSIGLVEDNQLVLDSMVQALRGLGHTVFAGSTGAQLLEQLGANAPDIMVCDYRLGAGETGLDVILAARARFGPDLPAIILTGDSDLELLRSLAEKEIPVCSKPLSLDVLQAHIRQTVKAR